MQTTSDTEFYSLSLNTLAPPPYSPRAEALPIVDVESGDEKSGESFSKGLVRRFTQPFLSTRSQQDGDLHASGAWPNAASRISHLVVDWWLWELLSWSMSALCILGIAVLLAYWNERAVPDHWPSGITLNAYIAVLSGIAKYALAVPVEASISQTKWHWFAQEARPLMDLEHFDDASRGPFGALKLMFRIKFKSIASVGAIVSILSLTMDPFFQQLVHLPKRPTALGQSAVPRMVNFAVQRNGPKNSTSDEDQLAPDRLLQDVTHSFMVNNGTNRNISAFCPSENCAWDPFETLAMCSSCVDVSSLLTLACLEESGEWRRKVSVNDDNVPRTFSCGYFLNATSEDPVLMSGYALNSSKTSTEPLEFLLMRSLNLQDVNVDQTYWGGSIHYKFPAFPIVDFIQVASPDAKSILAGEMPTARECALRWCTKRISATYEAGEYKEQVISEAFDDGEPFDALNWGEDMYFTYSKNISIPSLEPELNFFVPNDTSLSTIFLFQDFFPSYVSASNESTTPLLRTRNVLGQPPRLWTYQSNPFALLDGGNQYIEDMVGALTTVIRSYPGTSELFRGSGSVETYIRVRWGFFTLPLVLLCFTLLLLVVVMMKHRRDNHLGVWKSSVLASLAIGTDDKMRNLLTSTGLLSDVYEQASQWHVRLQVKSATQQHELVLDRNDLDNR